MQILPLHPLLAAEIRDFSLDQFEESDWTQIIESLKKYSVLVFRNQEIDNEAQIRFSEKLGPLETTKVGTEGAGTKLVFFDQRFKPVPNIKYSANNPVFFVVEFKFDQNDRELASRYIQTIPIRISKSSKYCNGLRFLSGK